MAGKKSQKQSISDRRRGMRASRVVAVRHRLIQRGRRKEDSVWSLSTTKNMSVSGLLFLSPVPYMVGDVVELEIVMSGMIDIYKGLAEVVRIHETSARSFDVAAKYVEVKLRPRSAKKHFKK